MMDAAQRRRTFAGPALFSFGFRPFFLGGAAWAALSVLLWLPEYFGEIALPMAFGPIDWHIHELLFGYLAAVVAGFLLTAIPNWTGRLPVQGAPLAALFAIWVAGRVAVVSSTLIGAPVAAVIDSAFLVALAGVAFREIVAGRNWRNLRVVVVVGLFALGNVVFHVETIVSGSADYGRRLGLGALIGLIMLIGGRIIPSFTHNWLARQAPGRLPQGFSRFDAISLGAAALAILAWIAGPRHPVTALVLIAAGVLHVARLARWAGERTWPNRLVLVLHVGYAFVPIGFLMLGASVLWPNAVPQSAGLHAWTAGAAGIITLSVMTRATRGHTGRSLDATPATQAIYMAVLIAVLARIGAAFGAAYTLLHVAAFAWIAAFGAFVVVYGPYLVRKRVG